MQKIFIVQMTRMGDIVQTLPLIKGLKERNEDCEITLMCIMEPMELIRSSRWVDRLLYVPFDQYKDMLDQNAATSAKLQALFEDIPELNETYDLVINLTHNVPSAAICQKLNGKLKSGRIQTQQDKIRAVGDWAKYLFSVVDNRAQNSFNLVDISIGMGGVHNRPVNDYLEVTALELAKAGELLKSLGRKGRGPLVALQMGANELHRAWPVTSFASLARQLMTHPGIEIVLLGIPKERALGQEFCQLVDFPVINLIGLTKVTEMPALLKSCDILVSNDTGTAHIAAAVGTRVLGLYFSTAYYTETAPYGKDHVIMQVELPCSPCFKREHCESIICKDYLDPEAVHRAAAMMLNGGSIPGFNYPNLSVYQSRFLANHTMIYAPLSSAISDQFQTGFINRVLWEKVLGLDHDMEFIERYLPAVKCLEQRNTKIHRYRRDYDKLKQLFCRALQLAHNVNFEFYRTPLEKDRILSINDQLAATQTDIMASPDSMLKSFHHYELMDLEYTTYADIARQILGKYVKLGGMADSFTAALDEFFFSDEGNGSVLPGIATGSPSPLEALPVNHPSISRPSANGEVLFLGLSSGENFGWGICGDYLRKELSKRQRIISLGDRKDLANRSDIPGEIFHTISAVDFSSLFQARGTQNYGYTFFENELTKAHIEKAEEYGMILAGSTWCKEKLLEKGIQNTEVLIQGVDPELFHPILEEKAQDSFVIFSGGKFELRKGQDLVLRAVKVLQEKYRDILLVNMWFNKWPKTMEPMSLSPYIDFRIEGDSWEDMMNHLCAINGLDAERIHTFSLVPHWQLRSIYRLTDIGVFPNRCEGGTNLMLMEYMACAKPVIASYSTGHKDILTDENALLLKDITSFRMQGKDGDLVADWEEPSLDELIAQIEHAYHHRDEIRRIGSRGGEDLKEYTWSRTAERLLEIISH